MEIDSDPRCCQICCQTRKEDLAELAKSLKSLARQAGLEPATVGLEVRYSSLSQCYIPVYTLLSVLSRLLFLQDIRGLCPKMAEKIKSIIAMSESVRKLFK